jgi:glutamyl/glutaminyl-tRNA synthetase
MGAGRTGASCCPISTAILRAAAHGGHLDDLMRGEETVDLASLSDPVLIREDGTYLYTLPSVVDDIEFGVTHVIRGDDHVTNTGVQIALFRRSAPSRRSSAITIC